MERWWNAGGRLIHFKKNVTACISGHDMDIMQAAWESERYSGEVEPVEGMVRRQTAVLRGMEPAIANLISSSGTNKVSKDVRK